MLQYIVWLFLFHKTWQFLLSSLVRSALFPGQKWLIFQDIGKHFPSLVNDSWLWRIWRKSETEKYFVWIHDLLILIMQSPVSMVKHIYVFISSILDPLQKQLDCHQVTARNNFKVRLAQKFLFLDEQMKRFFIAKSVLKFLLHFLWWNGLRIF